MARPKKSRESGLNVPTGGAVDNPFIERAREQWKEANAAEEDNRKEALEDLRFLDLDQWPTDVKALRSERGRERPTLTIDQISQPYRQLLSNQQQADAAITVVPESGLADEETAEFIQGLIRSIEYQSDSKTAYGLAFASAISGGWGYLRMRSEYEGPDTFDQRLIIEAIENQFSVYADPAARQPDRSDIRYALITQDLPWAEYKRQYGDSKLAEFDETPKVNGAGLIEFAGTGNSTPDWFPDGNVRIAEWYRLEHDTVTLYEGSDGRAYKSVEEMPAEEGVTPTGRQRTADIPYVTWCKINGVEVLEGETDEKSGKVKQNEGRRIPGTTIPLRPCYGEVLNVNGKRVYRGIVRAARDSQRMYNYWNSAAVEDMALAPKPPIMGAEGQFEGHEEKFEQANTRAFPYLEYKPLTLGGTPVPPPMRPPGPDPARMQGMSMLISQAKTDLRSTTGWYDATDPNRKASEQSGKAIQARKASQDQAGLPYFENFRLTLVSIGKLLLEWLPVIYDREHRIVRVLAGEDKPEFAMMGPQGFTRGKDGQPQPPNPLDQAEKIERFDLSKSGTYGIRVILGPSFTTKREEAASTLGTLISNQPQMMGVFGDLWVKSLDIPDAQEIADRVRRTIPPQILGEDGMEDVPPQIMAKMQQADQMIKAMQQQIAEMTKVIETKQIEQQGKAQIASQQLQGDMAMEQLKQENARNIAQLKADVDILAQHVKLLIAQQTATSEQARTELQSRADGLNAIGSLAGQASEAQRIPSSNGSGTLP